MPHRCRTDALQVRGEPPAVLCHHSSTPLHGRLWVFGGSVTARPARGSAAMGAAAGAKRGRVRCSSQLHTLEHCSDGKAVRWTWLGLGLGLGLALGLGLELGLGLGLANR